MFEDGIFVEVKNDAQIVEIVAKAVLAVWLSELASAAQIVIFFEGNVVAAISVVFKSRANANPNLW